MNKVVLVSIDGMRPDGVQACGNPYVQTLMQEGAYAMSAQTVMPTVTLPCHMSMFHSVDPTRHGIVTNTYTPQVRPVNGLAEQLRAAGKKCAMFYGWEPLKDITRPESLTWAGYINAYADEHTDGILTDMALECMRKYSPDFVFLYMVETDEKGGHDSGWMTPTYLDYISHAIDNVKRVVEEFGDEYTVIVTADHGGHDRAHGMDIPEDRTIPMFFRGPAFKAGEELKDVTILDIAPTIASIMGASNAPEWEGKSLKG